MTFRNQAHDSVPLKGSDEYLRPFQMGLPSLPGSVFGFPILGDVPVYECLLLLVEISVSFGYLRLIVASPAVTVVNFHFFSTLRAVCITNFMLLVEISHSKKIERQNNK